MFWGNLEPSITRMLADATRWEEGLLIPRDRWPKLIRKFNPGPYHRLRPPVHNQGTVPQCNADAVTTLLEYLRAIADLPYIQLSPADLYDRIMQPSGGSYLGDAIAEVLANGVGTAAVSGTIYKLSMTPSSEEDRVRFRLIEVRYCPTFDHQMSAVLNGFGIVSPLNWYSAYKPGLDGWLTEKKGRLDKHTVFGCKPAMKRVNGEDQYGIWYMHSQGNWNLATQNCGVVPEAELSGGFAGRMVTDDGGVVPITINRRQHERRESRRAATIAMRLRKAS